MKKKLTINKLFKFIGNIIMVIAIVMIVRKLISYEIDYSIIFAKENILYFMGIIIIYSICVIFGGIPWKNILNALYTSDIKYKDIIYIIVKANILKYVPGNIFQYIGRNELAIKKNMKHSEVAFATIIDVCWYVFSILLLVLIIAKNDMMSWLNQQRNVEIKLGIMIIIIVTIFTMIGMYYIKNKTNKFIRIIRKIRSFRFFKALLINFIFYSVMGFANALMYMGIFTMISGEWLTEGDAIICIGAMLIAMVVGFIVPGAPGGMGVREAVSLFLLKGMIAESVVVSGIVIMRVISIIGDIVSYFIVFIYERSTGGKIFYEK